MGFGKELVKACVAYAAIKKAYKIILNCRQELVPFYESLGFGIKDVAMRMDL
jgi:predicted GNAT family N-acyltransferase